MVSGMEETFVGGWRDGGLGFWAVGVGDGWGFGGEVCCGG